MRFPPIFASENINPLECKCMVVTNSGSGMSLVMYDNLDVAKKSVNLEGYQGPMADKDREGNWCLRFECMSAYRSLSV